MNQGKSAWNAWDVPYFGIARPAGLEPKGVVDLPLADGGARLGARVLAVLIGLGAFLAGAVVTGGLLFVSVVLSFGDTPDRGEVLVAVGIGVAVAISGLAIAVATYREAGRPLYVRLAGDRLEIAYRTFRVPFVVSRADLRVVAVDDAPVLLFTDNKRFPIAGRVPAHAFADALDNWPAAPWDDLDPDRRGPFPSVPVTHHDVTAAEMSSRGYAHDEPARPGWASGGSTSTAVDHLRTAHLWSAAGASLPFLRLGPADVPNLAIIFSEALRPPRPAWWLGLSPAHARYTYLRRGRAVRGLLLRVRDASGAERAFSGWNVLRPVTSDDIVDEGLLVGKPLAGGRAIAYGAIVIGSLVVDAVFRLAR